MTKKEFLNAVIANDVTEEVVAEAQKQLEAMELAHESAKAQKAEEYKNDIDAILEVLTDELQKASEIQEALAEKDYDISVQKIGHRMRLAAELGLVELDWIPVGSKNHRGYKLVK